MKFYFLTCAALFVLGVDCYCAEPSTANPDVSSAIEELKQVAPPFPLDCDDDTESKKNEQEGQFEKQLRKVLNLHSASILPVLIEINFINPEYGPTPKIRQQLNSTIISYGKESLVPLINYAANTGSTDSALKALDMATKIQKLKAPTNLEIQNRIRSELDKILDHPARDFRERAVKLIQRIDPGFSKTWPPATTTAEITPYCRGTNYVLLRSLSTPESWLVSFKDEKPKVIPLRVEKYLSPGLNEDAECSGDIITMSFFYSGGLLHQHYKVLTYDVNSLDTVPTISERSLQEGIERSNAHGAAIRAGNWGQEIQPKETDIVFDKGQKIYHVMTIRKSEDDPYGMGRFSYQVKLVTKSKDQKVIGDDILVEVGNAWHEGGGCD